MAIAAIRALPFAATMVALPLLLASCGSPLRPFVQSVKEFEPENRSTPAVTMVEVCYNRATTTPEAVRKLAEDACREKGRRAKFVRHRFLHCPLLQPASANFACR